MHPGECGYSLIEAGDGVMSSISYFDTSAQADESTRLASNWVREQTLETALPNAPMMKVEVLALKRRHRGGDQLLPVEVFAYQLRQLPDGPPARTTSACASSRSCA